MNKKVMALAVAGALAAPAAALAQVEIGGSLHYQYFNNDTGTTASKKTDVLTASEPEIYIRGEDKLGGGNSAWFQCTSSFDMLGSTATSSSAGWCGRNSGMGFKGSWGNAFVGTWDTPQKLISNQARGWWGGTNTLQGGSQVLLGNGAASNLGNTGASFYRRQARSINYWSPNFSGFTVNAAFSASNETASLPESSPLQPRLYSLGGMYATGPLFVGLGYEQHKDFNPGAVAVYTGGTDTNWNIAAGYTIAGAVRLSVLYMDNKYEIGNVTSQDLKKQGYALYLDWTIAGPHKLYAQYASVDDSKGSSTVAVGGYAPGQIGAASNPNGTGGSVTGIAYGYSFSKRTQGYIAYNQMDSDSGANFTFGTSGSTYANPGTNGGKQKVIGIGARMSF